MKTRNERNKETMERLEKERKDGKMREKFKIEEWNMLRDSIRSLGNLVSQLDNLIEMHVKNETMRNELLDEAIFRGFLAIQTEYEKLDHISLCLEAIHFFPEGDVRFGL